MKALRRCSACGQEHFAEDIRCWETWILTNVLAYERPPVLEDRGIERELPRLPGTREYTTREERMAAFERERRL